MNVLTVVASAVPSLTVPAFGFLRYRAYLKTVRHIVDVLGGDGLKMIDTVTPPSSLATQLPLRKNDVQPG
ncbi:hypothetical protein AB0C38_11470 [Amycolatopsis sp. NPDC048633]|uniref:hypothetical protein n=1 Tax=Amycolatopsis sp. NPDC048633 TaxID=3157095 RepID=UPI0033D6A93F